jgi:hypothetical protein
MIKNCKFREHCKAKKRAKKTPWYCGRENCLINFWKFPDRAPYKAAA